MPATLTLTIPILFGRATAVLGEHATLHGVLSHLRDACAVVGDASPETGSRYQLLLELRERLRAHFAAEEDDGYFETLSATQPSRQAEVSRLEQEHQAFLVMVDRLLDMLEGPDDADFARELSTFFERFNAHERAENALLQDFFLRDEGDSGH